MKTASDLKIGEKAIIKDIDNSHFSSHRILEIGFTPGQEIQLVSSPLFNDPIALMIRGSIIAIRKSDARCIII
ncbi:MAG: FeoA family protein [Ignavibacteria bacterium]|nr:ferrous iron transport protein A [Ignavibacteriota bacterium]